MRRAYPINVKATEVAGIPAYQNIKDVPGDAKFSICIATSNGVFDALKTALRKR